MSRRLRLISLGVAAATVLAISGAALADRSEGLSGHDRATVMYGRYIKKLDAVEAQLKLAPEQQHAWVSFKATQLKLDQRRLQNKKNHREKKADISTKDHLEMMKERIEAMQALYASLRPDQQLIFDKAVRRSH